MRCRSCGSPTEVVLSLGTMPLPNHLLTSPAERYDEYPIDLAFCSDCKLGQLAEVVPPELMFSDYAYYSSASKPTVDAAHKLATDILVGFVPDLVVEIGSNDGYLLDVYRGHGCRVLGIDPASGPANAAALRGVPTIQNFFTLDIAGRLPKADVVHANNVLAHVPDLNDFVAGIATLLSVDGIAVIEVPYLGDLVSKAVFDTIYAEHSYYFSMTAAIQLFARHGLAITKIERIPAHGGSLRLYFARGDSAGQIESLGESFDFAAMSRAVAVTTHALEDFLVDAHRRGKRVWGYGAAAKATVMLNYCGIDQTLIQACTDTTPAKVGRFIPGTGVPIVHPQDWLDAQPDYTCIFAWNYANYICNRYVTEYKGTFFTPYVLPEKAVSA